MADRPIIFSAPMVRALHDGRKTQTRRIASFIKPAGPQWHVRGRWADWYGPEGRVSEIGLPHARYAVGDRLYVREHWRVSSAQDKIAPRDLPSGLTVEFVADGPRYFDGKHRQGMHMPRWASRMTLLIKEVRIERLQAISEVDAQSEGADRLVVDEEGAFYAGFPEGTHRCGFAGIWSHLHGTESWDANPFVVAVTFSVRHGNIDQIGGDV